MNAALMGLLALFFGHAIADFGLQNDFVAGAKNRHIPKFATMLGTDVAWVWVMLAHCLMHAGFVLFITHSVTLTVAELVLHFAIDCGKCEGKYGFSVDQALHYGCKVAYWLLLVSLPHFGHGGWLR